MNVRIPGPDQTSENGERELDLAAPAGALAVDEALPDRGRLALLHARAELAADVLHRRGGDLVREPHPLDLLRRLERARRASSGVASAASGKASNQAVVNVVGSPTMRSEACVPSESSSPTRRSRAPPRRASSSVRAGGGRGSVCVVAAEEAHVRRPGRARGVLGRGLEADQHGLALAREDARRRSPSCPRSSSGRGRCRARARRARRARARPSARARGRASRRRAASAHQRTRGGAGSPCASCHEMTGLRSTPIRSISALHHVAGLEVERRGVGR